MESNPVRIDELLAHAGWVRKLAARLVRDAGTAEDVAQEVWAYALRSPPRDRRNLQAWLSAAVRNAARSLSRSEARRSERELAAVAHSDVAAAAELVERAHLHRDLVEHVLALDEPFRSLVLAHWFEEQSLAECGRRLGLTSRVARLRLEEAHVLLRRRLDRAAGGREAWSLLFLKWTETPNAAAAAAAAGTALTLGGIAVSSKIVVGTLVVVVSTCLGWLLWPSAGRIQAEATSVGTPTARVAGVDGSRDELAQVSAPSPREALAEPGAVDAAAPPAPGKRWVVRGHVRGAAVGRESETTVSAQFLGRYNIPDTASTLAGRDGAFEIDVSALVATWLRNAEPSELLVVADHPACMGVEARLPFASAQGAPGAEGEATYECVLTLRPAAVACGRVLVPKDWKPLQGRGPNPVRPQVALFDFAAPNASGQAGLDHATCDADGRWTLKVDRSGTFTLAACADGLRPELTRIELALGRRTEAPPLELGRGESLSGTVRRAGLAVGPGTGVSAFAKSRSGEPVEIRTSDGTPVRLFQASDSLEYALVSTRTLADGSYRFDGLAPVEYELCVADLPDLRMRLGGRTRIERTVRATQAGVDLDGVPPTIELAVTVDGRAPTDAELEGVIVDLVPGSAESGTGAVDLTRSATGYGKIQVHAGVSYELRVRPGRYAPTLLALGQLESGEERTFALDLRRQERSSTLVVRFVTERQEDPEQGQFGFQDSADPRGERIVWVNVERSPEGAFVLRDRAPGSYRVHVRPYEFPDRSSSNCYVPTQFDVVLEPKARVERELRLELGGRVRMSARDEHGGYVRAAVELRDARGETIPTEFYCVTASTFYGCDWYLCEQGPNDHPPLPTGHYEFTLRAEGFADELAPVDLLAGETTSLEIVLHPK